MSATKTPSAAKWQGRRWSQGKGNADDEKDLLHRMGLCGRTFADRRRGGADGKSRFRDVHDRGAGVSFAPVVEPHVELVHLRHGGVLLPGAFAGGDGAFAAPLSAGVAVQLRGGGFLPGRKLWLQAMRECNGGFG